MPFPPLLLTSVGVAKEQQSVRYHPEGPPGRPTATIAENMYPVVDIPMLTLQNSTTHAREGSAFV